MIWVYKCNSRNLPHQVAYGDWEDFFAGGRTSEWGSTEWTQQIEQVSSHDTIIAYQTDRNEIVGLASVVRLSRRRQFLDLVLRPDERVGVKVRPLKLSDPRIGAIPAFKPGPIKTLYEISDEDARRLLKAAGVEVRKFSFSGGNSGGAARGAGFGTWEENRQVEVAAVAVVKRDFKAKGWSVTDVSPENRGYDLVCKRAGRELHVEVKGTSGEQLQFPITSNERRRWSTDRVFVLALVTKALTQSKLQLFRGSNGLARFEFNPLSYMARLAG